MGADIRSKNIKEESRFPLKQVYFYLTEGCNLACRHCWLSPGLDIEGISYPSLPLNLFKSIIQQAKHLGLSGVKLTGGEPLMHPEIYRMIDFVRDQEINLSIETNGVFCDKKLAGKIAQCRNASAAVSLDGADARTHEWIRGIPGCFDAAREGIRNLAAVNVEPQVIMTVMEKNKDQMIDVVRLAESLGAGSVKFNIVQPTGRGEKMNSNGQTLSVKKLIEIGRWVENTLCPSTKIKVYYHSPLAFHSLSRMFAKGGDGCTSCNILNIIGVLPDGSYALCGIGTHIPGLVFGHAAKQPLADIWRNSPVLSELREGIPHRFEGTCGNCLMKKVCLGCCIAQNFYLNKNPWSPFWFCESASKAGLFPETRLIKASR